MNAISTISPANARLPQTYESAKTALSECVALDECKSWADKAAALASYAKQANDDELMKMATRIRDRAIRRAGELLQQIDGQGSRTDQLTEGSHGKLTQRQAAADAGMSEHQQLQAVRVASIPREDFDRQVDSDKPPTLSQLAQQGIKRPLVDLRGRDPKEFNRSMHFAGDIERYAAEIAKADLDLLLPGLIPAESERIRRAISKIDSIHDRIITRI